MSELNDRSHISRYSSLVAEQRNNQATRELWSRYAGHRKVMTGLVQTMAESLKNSDLPTLCVLGAGNVNDLSLAELLPLFAEIRLVDFDQQAVEAGIARQAQTIVNPDLAALFRKRVSFAGPFDLSGISDLLAIGFQEKVMPDEHCQTDSKPFPNRLREALSRQRPEHTVRSLGCSDVVVSACMLSQLVRQVGDVIGQSSTFSNLLSWQVVSNHLHLSLALT